MLLYIEMYVLLYTTYMFIAYKDTCFYLKLNL